MYAMFARLLLISISCDIIIAPVKVKFTHHNAVVATLGPGLGCNAVLASGQVWKVQTRVA